MVEDTIKQAEMKEKNKKNINSQEFVSFFFSKRTDHFFFLFCASIPSVICRFPLFIMNVAHFLCQIPSLNRHYISSLPVLLSLLIFLHIECSQQ